MNLTLLLNLLASALAQAAVLSLVTMAITLIYKTSFTTNFAQGMIATLSVYFITMFQINTVNTTFPNISPVLSLLISVIAGIILGFLIGVFIDVILVRKSKYSNPLSKQMITMGVVLAITGIIPTVYFSIMSSEPTLPAIASGSWIIPVGQGNLVLVKHNMISILIAALVISIIFIALKYTKWGLGVRTTASNERVASMMGVNTKLITALSWGIAGGLGALAASLNVPIVRGLTINMMVFMQVNGFLASVLGGFSTFFGPIVGAIIIPVASVLFTRISSLWYRVLIYVLILLIVLIKPIGLFGKRVAKKV